ncbi:hypothetical protein [Methylobacterium komagatae]
MTMTPEMLARAGEALTGGDNWAKPVARALGAYHPSGPRETIDPRSVSRWRTGEMDILDWAAEALPLILREHAAALEAEAERLRDAADRKTEAADDMKDVADDIEAELRGPRP